MPSLLDTALAFHAAGLCVVPVRPDGSKAPAAFWKDYQQRRPTGDQVRDWFTHGDYDGLGVICGAVSGGLELLEFEGRAMREGYWARFRAALIDHGLADLGDRIANGYAEATPSGGLHILYRVDGTARRNTKLASRPARDDELTDPERAIRAKNPGKAFPRVLVETRGEGGFVVVAPSGGRTHPTGKPWSMITGGPDTIATITEEERDALHAIASLLDEMPAPAPAAPAAPNNTTQREDCALRPGDDFNQKATWDDILTPHGWTCVAAYGQGRAWRRPGKTRGISATTGTRGDADNLYVFSTSTEFEPEVPYTKFGAWALLNYGGDHAAAACALRAQGYGTTPDHGDDFSDLLADPPANHAQTAADGSDSDEALEIDITDEPAAIQRIIAAINSDKLPNLYVRDGQVVEIVEPSGSITGLIRVETVTPDRLRHLLAVHAHTYKVKTSKETTRLVPASPSVAVCQAVLACSAWPGLRALRGVVHAPIIRPDGTLLQDPGYDEATGLYLSPRITVPEIPDEPTDLDVARAKRLVFGTVLRDFCFDSDASKANYTALLMTPALRHYIDSLAPLGLISSTTRGSGKTLLGLIMDALYGLYITTWQPREEELVKAITAVFRDSTAPVVMFDNVGTGDTVDHATLAMLLTSRTWTGRILGRSRVITAANDRLWLATGNNIMVGGDIASRSVLVRLDPQMERPEKRTGFAIDDLEGWLRDDTNRAELLHAVLTLARAWIAAGAPQGEATMRTFTPWARAMAGLTTFLGLSGFLANEAELVESADEEEAGTVAFLMQWHRMYGSQPKRAIDLLDSARADCAGGQWHDPWQGTFPTRANGNPFTAKGLARFLAARRGRIFSGLRLDGQFDRHSKIWTYRVVRVADSESPEEGAM